MSQQFQRALHALSAYVGKSRRVKFPPPILCNALGASRLEISAGAWQQHRRAGARDAQAPQYASVERCQLGAGMSYVAVPWDT